MQLNEEIQSNHHGEEKLSFIKNPLHFEKLENAKLKEPPVLGQDTEEILGDILKYDKRKIQELRDKRVI